MATLGALGGSATDDLLRVNPPRLSRHLMRHAPLEPVFLPSYLRRLCEMLREEGGDVAAVLAEAGLTEQALADDSRMLPLATARWLILAMQRAAPRPTLALEAGARLRLGAHAALGQALASGPNLRAALGLLVRYMPLRTGLFQPRLAAEGDGLRYTLEPRLALGELHRFLHDHALAANCNAMRALSGGALDGVTLHLPWPRPAWHAAYACLAEKQRYGAETLAVVLPAAVLDRPHPQADPLAHALAVQACEAALQSQHAGPSFVQRVQAQLRGPCQTAFVLAEVAAALGVSTRTVVRRLEAEGSSFQLLLDEARRQRAVELLRHTRMPVAAVALALGYRSASNFARSFKRWFGVLPSAYRDSIVI